MTSALALTFHCIRNVNDRYENSRTLAGKRYTVLAGQFMEAIARTSSKNCCTLSEFRSKREGSWLILTFDDGFLSDFEIAFPVLVDKAIKGTFFITVGNVGQPGYVNNEHLQEMVASGMEIGSHGLTHQYLINMPRLEAAREIRESKDRLEQQLGAKVKSFAPVGGHFRQWMLAEAREAGYQAFATMAPGRTMGNRNFLLLRRNHIQAHHHEDYLLKLLAGDKTTLLLNRLRYHLLHIPKAVLGMRNYDRAKRIILEAFSHIRSYQKS